MKSILLIGTGGTISCRPAADGALAPALSVREILEFVPELDELCHIDTLQLYDLDSTNIGPEHWLGMASAVRKHYDGYDGFVILHGTDTMAYSAAALSYLIQHSRKPIVLTGSQKSIYNRDTDARNNMLQAQGNQLPHRRDTPFLKHNIGGARGLVFHFYHLIKIF